MRQLIRQLTLIYLRHSKTPAMPYYAVARGRQIGIFKTWDECKTQVTGFQNSRFKKFLTHEEAQEFIDVNKAGGEKVKLEPSVGKGASVASASYARKRSRSRTPPGTKGPRNLFVEAKKPKVRYRRGLSPHKDAPVCYTDGACRNNGKRNARAGVGVFWGDGDQHNYSAPLASGDQTNNRAEYTAVVVAIETASERGFKKLNIRTDSNLLIQSVTQWLPNWQRNGWKTGNGQPVKNRDLLERIVELSRHVDVRYEHVPGHAGIHGNEMADRLACAGADGASTST